MGSVLSTLVVMLKILVIEDDELIQETLVQLLETQNFAVKVADNGRMGVQMALSQVPDLILCDVQMPELNGYEVLETLRQNPLVATIPFIFLTAQDEKADIRHGMDLGADDYLTKPFTQSELLRSIKSRLDKHAAVTKPFSEALQHAEERLSEWVNSTDVHPFAREKLEMEAMLRRALTRGEFQVYYQPQVDMETGYIQGAEALVRWLHPQRGMISPVEFIPLAEETGFIVPLGDWVLQSACTQAVQWINSGFSDFRISVNLSARQLSDLQLPERVVQILETTGLPPGNLELEVTESAVMENAIAARETLGLLKSLGVRIAIDDFGTGYASLGYLKEFPFDTLKIDKTFVKSVSSELKNAAITKAVILLAHSLGLEVVAEGVETEAELAFLREHQCDCLQGYFFSRPVPAHNLEHLLTTGKRLSVEPKTAKLGRVIHLVPPSDREKSSNFSLSFGMM
jgi:EAL domain-containing protein (putative c-di-GMP-specific phosphodiesterase class I)/FixJ family two-component response regulator